MHKFKLNLKFFDGEGAPAGMGSGENTSVAGENEGVIEAQVATEEPVKPDPEARKAEYLKMRQEYKDLYDSDVQNIIGKRFKEVKGLEKRLSDVNPILDILGPKYGVTDGDMAKLAKAIQEDSSLIEEEAMKHGLTVEQYQQMRKLERENAEFKRMQQEAEERTGREQAWQALQNEANALKQKFPEFDLESELNHPTTGEQFAGLLRSGYTTLEGAYKAVHADELLMNGMQLSAQKAKEATVKTIQSRNSRPSENGISSSAGVAIRQDPSKLTFNDIDDLVKRVGKGEKISFS